MIKGEKLLKDLRTVETCLQKCPEMYGFDSVIDPDYFLCIGENYFPISLYRMVLQEKLMTKTNYQYKSPVILIT